MLSKIIRRLSSLTGLSLLFFLFVGVNMPASAQVDIDINFDVKHVVGDVDSFDREKYIVIHADATESDYNNHIDLIEELLIDYDAHYGRDTGRMRYIGEVVGQDPTRPGYASPNDISRLSNDVNNQYAENFNRHPTEFKGKTITSAQDRPFFPDGHLTQSGFAYSQLNNPSIDDDFGTATGEFMGLFLRDAYGNGGRDGPPRPTWIEVMNEPFFPLVDFAAAGNQASIEDIFELHRSVAREVKRINPNALVGGFTNAFPDLAFRTPESSALFSQWDERWRRFIDEAGDDMDFYSIHFYDFHSIGGGNASNSGTLGAGVTASSREILRRGSNIEATMDMIEHYSTIRHGAVKPWVISEYGGQLNDFYSERWSPRRDWLLLKSFNSMMMQFMERPDVIEKTVPFVLGRADFLFGNIVPERVYPWRMLRGPNEPNQLDRNALQNAVFTEMVKFYQLWSDVKGTRVDTLSTNPDIMVDAYVNTDENKAYVILNSLNKTATQVNLNELGMGPQNITAVNIKHLFLGANSAPQLSDDSFATVPNNVRLNPEATMVIEYIFDSAPAIDETSNENKIYATTYNQQIRANQSIEFTIPNVAVADQGEALLRLGFGRDAFLSRSPNIRVNGARVEVPSNYRGDEQANRDVFQLGRNLFFGMLEVSVPYQLLSAGNNTVEITFPDGADQNSGAVSSVALQTFDFSRPVVRTNATRPDPPTTQPVDTPPQPVDNPPQPVDTPPQPEPGLVDRPRSITWDNDAAFITQSGEQPTFELGDQVDFTVTYATEIVDGVEEDLSYVATQIRQLDETRSIVATSAFQITIPDSANNAATTTFSYTIPSSFATGSDQITPFTALTPIPESESLPEGHSLQLVLFMATENATFFANANTEIVIDSVDEVIAPDQTRARSVIFNNIEDFIPSGADRPELNIGQTLNINISYETGISGLVEEDLFYIAMFVRQEDENGARVADSAFTVVVPNAASNSGTANFGYSVPSNFSVNGDGAPFNGAIPNTDSLPAGHQLKLILFMSTNNDSAFADANTDITVSR